MGKRCELKKIILIFAIIIVLLFLAIKFTGCKEYINDNSPKSNLDIARDVAQNIMDCFIDKDEEALYSILAQEAQEFEFTKKQIHEAFDFIDGEIISYELPTDTGGGGFYKRSGKVMSESIAPCIYFKTDKEKLYSIWFQYFLIHVDDINIQGLDRISVSLLDKDEALVERLGIGYEFDEKSRFPQ